jgi:hypothetical protein
VDSRIVDRLRRSLSKVYFVCQKCVEEVIEIRRVDADRCAVIGTQTPIQQ